ncbi:hypothetical protein CW304_30805 [Bacillus sp. UFRGS-B20]|nr:hypothetical protein CW304_30805 [Bacillus sp. UFRGS-B20]
MSDKTNPTFSYRILYSFYKSGLWDITLYSIWLHFQFCFFNFIYIIFLHHGFRSNKPLDHSILASLFLAHP